MRGVGGSFYLTASVNVEILLIDDAGEAPPDAVAGLEGNGDLQQAEGQRPHDGGTDGQLGGASGAGSFSLHSGHLDVGRERYVRDVQMRRISQERKIRQEEAFSSLFYRAVLAVGLPLPPWAFQYS